MEYVKRSMKYDGKTRIVGEVVNLNHTRNYANLIDGGFLAIFNDTSHNCKICDRKFATNMFLKGHEKISHPKNSK